MFSLLLPKRAEKLFYLQLQRIQQKSFFTTNYCFFTARNRQYRGAPRTWLKPFGNTKTNSLFTGNRAIDKQGKILRQE